MKDDAAQRFLYGASQRDSGKKKKARRKHNRPADQVAQSGKNPPAVNFSAPYGATGQTIGDAMRGILEEYPDCNMQLAMSWMMNCTANARAANAAGVTAAEARDHMKRLAERLDQLITDIENPAWWELLVPELYQIEISPSDLPLETIEKKRWLTVEAGMIERLTLLSAMQKRAAFAAEKLDSNISGIPKKPIPHALAEDFAKGIAEGILPFQGVDDPAADELFKIACNVAEIRAREPLAYYAASKG
ncbi:MAG: hypothetical protein FKY71_16885 [Spiribacter salinus]|uniref:Uncharacterized protein n=1 Tax=Spiribacter salinus TaxID=1335746 RepID=A0A540VIG1_9GAMM|nr:MAG: hypothetical protein FKY71_16885 [Spiribacter salinus]